MNNFHKKSGSLQSKHKEPLIEIKFSYTNIVLNQNFTCFL